MPDLLQTRSMGRWGQVPITIADVAARAGVSKTTVSRVLNGKGELDISTATRVRKVIDDLGYVPSARAVGLARGRTRIVGMLVPSLTWPWIGDVLQGAVDVLESESYGLLLFTCNRGEESMRQFATQVSAKSFDGLLVIEPEGTIDYIADLHERGLPVVLIDDRGHRPQFPSVVTTNRDGGSSAAAHLVGLGRTKPIVITGIERFPCTQDRLDGFGEVFIAAGIPLAPERIIEGDFTYDCGRMAVKQAIANGIEFDSIFAHNDLSAIGAMQAIREVGLRVPDDIAVVGFDDVPSAAHTDPPLTTVHQPLRQMGAAAAHMLLDHFSGNQMSHSPTVIPTELVVRGTTPLPTTPPLTTPLPGTKSAGMLAGSTTSGSASIEA
jgi:LacI family transcriptional regulator